VAIAPTQSLDTVSSLVSYFGWRRRMRHEPFLRDATRPSWANPSDLHEGWVRLGPGCHHSQALSRPCGELPHFAAEISGSRDQLIVSLTMFDNALSAPTAL